MCYSGYACVSSHHLIQPRPPATLSWSVKVPDNLGLMKNSLSLSCDCEKLPPKSCCHYKYGLEEL